MLKLFLCGDVMTGRGLDQILAHPVDPLLHESYVRDARQYVTLAEQASGPIAAPVEDRYVWGDALATLQRNDPAVRLINLETAVTTSDHFWEGKGIHYRMSPRNFGCITAAGIDCATLANNHVLDWGAVGLRETLRVVQGAGVKTTGAGHHIAEAVAPAVCTARSGEQIAVFGVAVPSSGVPASWAATEDQPGVALMTGLSSTSLAELAGRVEVARSRGADRVIVSIHWGGNWGYRIPPEQRVFAHRLIDDAAVDLVHGHSSHHIQGIEVHRGRLILYGCGDLITDYEGIAGHEAYRGDLALMYFPELDAATGELTALRMHPVQLRRMRLCGPTDEDVDWIVDVLNREGRALGTGVAREEDGSLVLRWER